MSMIQTPRESGAGDTCDVAAQILTPMSRADIEAELFELVALGDVLLSCQSTDCGGSFHITLGMLVTRLRDVAIAVELMDSEGRHD